MVMLVIANGLFWQALAPKAIAIPNYRDIECISYNPYYTFDYSGPPTESTLNWKQVDTDLNLISALSGCIRMYFTDPWTDKVVKIAHDHNISVIAGVWVDTNEAENNRQVKLVTELANNNPNVASVIVGNETFLRNAVNYTTLVSYINIVKRDTNVPVSTAGTYGELVQYKNIFSHIDFISFNIFGYWDHQSEENSIEHINSEYQYLVSIAGGKPVIISETGWPSAGYELGPAKPGVDVQATFITDFIQFAKDNNIHYNIFSAFDEPWKAREGTIGNKLGEGRTGAHWGLMDVYGNIKFLQYQNDFEHWFFWAALAAVLGLSGMILFSLFYYSLRVRGHLFGLVVIQILAIVLVFFLRVSYSDYVIGVDPLWEVFFCTTILLIALIIIHLLESVAVIGELPLLRTRFTAPAAVYKPFVSIHVPCRNENPAVVIRTVESILKLNYPRFEIIIVDNNTKDKKVWQPVQAFAKQHKKIKFIHVERLQGFKAGALNVALRKTAREAEIIGVVDSDYQVDREWLNKTVGYFADKNIAVVQAPQGYVQEHKSLFKKMLYFEYIGFFNIGMVQRNEKNAIIQHGTMTLMRKKVLREVGEWPTHTITEDAELGLRILEKGYAVQYVREVLGRGIIPPTFTQYKKQRFRWVYGAVRILIDHHKELMGKGKLTFWQRYHFIAGWLPFIGITLGPTFSLLGIIGTYLLLSNARLFYPVEFIYPIMVYFVLLLVLITLAYRKRVGASFKEIVFSFIVGASLINTIAKAVLVGFLYKKMPFERTGKVRTPSEGWYQLLRSLRIELFFAGGLSISAYLVLTTYGINSVPAVVWSGALLIQSIPSFCAIFMTCLSELEL